MTFPSALRRVLIAAVWLTAASSVTAHASSCPGATIVKSAGASFIGAAQQGSTAAFSSALARHTDIDSLAMFALGPYRKNLPAARHGEYVRNTQRSMSQFLAGHASHFEGADFKIESCTGDLVQTSLDEAKWSGVS